MTAYATDSDLEEYVPTIFDHGVESFTTELTRATLDVQRHIEINWYNINFTTGFNQVGRRMGSDFDPDLLIPAQWKRSVIYLALYAYILPRLSPFRVEGDSFQEQITFYRARYNEEINAAMAKGVLYDLNDDGTITTGEKYRHRKDRLYR
jgi:hypothetical protein